MYPPAEDSANSGLFGLDAFYDRGSTFLVGRSLNIRAPAPKVVGMIVMFRKMTLLVCLGSAFTHQPLRFNSCRNQVLRDLQREHIYSNEEPRKIDMNLYRR